jgi:hypothetical protein
MNARYRDNPPRMNIPPSLNLQQPMGFDGRHNMPYSPALPTSLQHSLHPSFPMNNHSMQTPMQPFFAPQLPPAPGRPTHRGQPSLAQLSSAGVLPPNGMPLTPSGHGHFPHASMSHSGSNYGQQFPQRNRRQPSIGGPPKAVLGGPQRKVSPLPTPVPSSSTAAPTQKGKKSVVNLPKETVNYEGEPSTRPPWARIPVKPSAIPDSLEIVYPELTTAECFPPDSWRYHVPATLDVFLPGKVNQSL